MFKILASEAFELPQPIPNSVQIDIIEDLYKDKEKLAETAKQYDALIVRNMTKVDQALLSLFTSIKVIGRLGAGTENIDLAFAKQCGIAVVYAPVQNTNAVAEFCVGQVFNALRHIPTATGEAKQGVWNRGKYLSLGKELSSATIGVIGFGNIGQSFATKMKALGANVLVYNRTASKVTEPFQYTELEVLLSQSDLVSIHLPGGHATQHFMDKDKLGKLQKGAFLLNTSRGDLLDEEALLASLESEHLAGAIIDVRASEPAKMDALSTHPHCYPTPHIAAFTAESQTAISTSVISDVLKVLNNATPEYPAII